MADAKKYAEWIVANQDKKGTPEFDTVAQAYKQAQASIPGVQTQTREEVAGMVAMKAPGATAQSTITGMTPTQAQARGESGMERMSGSPSLLTQNALEVAPTVARYGVPVVAGLAANAAIPGSGLPLWASIGSGSAIGAGSSVLGESLAQLAEIGSGQREGYSGKEMLASGIAGAAPFVPKGGTLARIGMNVPLSVGFSEMGRAVVEGDAYSAKPEDAKEAFMRYGLPVAFTGTLSALGARAESLYKRRAQANQISAERMGGGVMVSDLLNSASDLEKRQIEIGNANALKAYYSMGENIGPRIAAEYNLPPTSELATKVGQMAGEITRLETQAAKTTANLAMAEQAAADAVRQNRADAPNFVAKAKEAALEKAKATILKDDGVRVMLGGNIPELQSVAAGRRNANLAELASNTKAVVKEKIGQLYGQAGIAVNDPVVGLDDVMESLKSQRGKGGALEGNEAFNKTKDVIAKAFGEEKTLTLEQYRNLRDKIATNLTKEGESPTYANRVASGAYDVVRSASKKYIKGNFGEDVLKSWEFANQAAATDFAARSGGAIDLISEGKADQLLNLIKEQGAGKVDEEIAAYANSIRNTGNPADSASVAMANAAANSFERSVATSVRDGLVDSSLDRSLGFDKDVRILDANKLATELQMLKSKGYDINRLGMGSPDQIRSLARVASANKASGYTPAELNDFLKDVAAIGADASAARVQYRRDVRDNLLKEASGINETTIAKNRKVENMRKARVDQGTALAEVAKAKSDPLMVFMNDTGMRLSKDIAQNGNMAARLLTVDAGTVDGMMDALSKSGRYADRDALRQAAAATVLRKFESVAENAIPRADLEAIGEFFNGGSAEQIAARNSFKAIMGKDGYDAINNSVGKAVNSVLSRSRQLYGPRTTPFSAEMAGLVKGRMGQSTGVALAGNLRQIADFVGKRRYNLLYTLYVNPTTAPKFAKAGYNIEKFVANQRVNALAVKMAMEADSSSEQQQEQP